MCGKADPNMTIEEYFASAGVPMSAAAWVSEKRGKLEPFTPISMVPILHLNDAKARAVTPMRWGWLTSRGSATPSRGAAVLHARSETIEEKNMWQDAFMHARGVMLTRSFNIGETIPGQRAKKQWVFARPDEKEIAIAVIYSLWRHRSYGDANMLGIHSYNGDLPNLRYLLQTFTDNKTTKVMVVYDGDKTGKTLQKNAKELCERLKVPTIELNKDKSIEDYVLFPDIFRDAVQDTIEAAAVAENVALPPDFSEQLGQKWIAAQNDKGTTRGKWFKDVSRTFLDGEEASKVALARNYAFRCREVQQTPPEGVERGLSVDLCQKIAKELGLPGIRAKQAIEAQP